jgi:CheY-like chemotaxis protein
MGPASPHALVVSRGCGPHVSRLLMGLGYSVEMQDPRSFRSLEDRAAAARLLVTDLHGTGAHAGPGLARKLRQRNPRLPVIFLAAHLDAGDVSRLGEVLPGAPTIQSPPNGRLLAMAIAAAEAPPPLPEAPQRPAMQAQAEREPERERTPRPRNGPQPRA